MLTHPTIEKLHALHLTAMATAFDQQRSASQNAELGFDDRFGLLVDTEWTAREQRRLTQRLRQAKLRYPSFRSSSFARRSSPQLGFARAIGDDQSLQIRRNGWPARPGPPSPDEPPALATFR